MSLLWIIFCLFLLTISGNLLSTLDPTQYFLFIPSFLAARRKLLAVLPSLRVSRTTFLLRNCQVFPGSRERHTWPVTSVEVEWCFVRMIQQWSLLPFSFSNVFILSIHFLPFLLLSFSPPFRIYLVFFSVASSFHRFPSCSRSFPLSIIFHLPIHLLFQSVSYCSYLSPPLPVSLLLSLSSFLFFSTSLLFFRAITCVIVPSLSTDYHFFFFSPN